MKRQALATVLLSLVLGGCDATPRVSTTVESPAVAADLLIRFHNVALPDQVGGEFMIERASHGGRLVVVQYTVKNTGRLPVPAYEIPAIRLFDREGVAYAPDAGLTAAIVTEPGMVADNKLFSDLNPGITTQGADVFEISRAAWAAGGWRVGWEGATEADLQPIGEASPAA